MLPTQSEMDGFKEIAKLGSISRAAQNLGISQPSLSQSIKKLEERIGSPLFIRSKAGMHLTEAGQIMLAETDEIQNLWKRAVSRASRHSEEFSGKIRIGCHVSVAQYALAPLLTCIHAEFPLVRVALGHGLSRQLVDQVLHNELDLAVAINPFAAPELVIRPLAQDEITLFAQGRNLRLEEAQALPLFIEPMLLQTQAILRKLYSDGFRFPNVIETSSLDVCGAMLRENAGACILPERVQKLFGPTAQKVVGAPKYKDVLNLVYRADRIHSSPAKVFMRRIEKVLKASLE